VTVKAKNLGYRTFVCAFVILIAVANLGRGIVVRCGGQVCREDVAFPPEPLPGSDFQIYPYMALRLLYGLPLYEERDYGDPRQAEVDRRYRRLFGPAPEAVKEWYLKVHQVPWNFPPMGAYLALPFAWVPRPWMYRILFCIHLAALSATLCILGRRAGDRLSYWLAAAALVAFSYPLRFHLDRGGLDMLALFLVTLGVVAWGRRGGAAVAGFCIALAIQLKLYPLIFLPYFALRREWRVCLSIILFSALLMAGCAFASREGVAAGFVQYVKLATFVRSRYLLENVCLFAGNHSTYNFLGALLDRWCIPPPALLRMAGAVNLALFGAVSALILGRPARDAAARLLECSLVILVMTVTPPEANDYTLVFLYFVFPACLLCFERLDFGLPSTRALFLLFSVNATVLFLPTMTPPFWEPPYGYWGRLWWASNKWPFLISLMAVVALLRRAAIRSGHPASGALP
jgi:hypothetical protein